MTKLAHSDLDKNFQELLTTVNRAYVYRRDCGQGVEGKGTLYWPHIDHGSACYFIIRLCGSVITGIKGHR